MAPAASILAAPTAASSKRPPASDTEQQQLLVDSSAHPQQGDGEAARKSQQPKQQQLECPRCRSTNTKFCYYNNYSTAQPRHFCRACRRYWTHGGTLRDVPVGGATRRCKRRRVSSEPPSSPQQQQKTAALVEDVALCPPVPSTAAFPFLSDGSYLPQLDLGCLFAPPAFSGAPDFYDGLAPWDVGTVGSGAAGVTGAWGDIAGMELPWPPPGN